jgi:hypothetical protein
MNDVKMRAELATRNALINQLHSCNMRPLEGTEPALEKWFNDKGAKLDASQGYLTITQSDGSAAVPSQCCETLRRERPELFVPDPSKDTICCKSDLEKGSGQDILRAKSQYIAKHGLESYTLLPKTRSEAEVRAIAPGPDITRKEYLSLSFRERSRLAGIIKEDGVRRIMARVKG